MPAARRRLAAAVLALALGVAGCGAAESTSGEGAAPPALDRTQVDAELAEPAEDATPAERRLEEQAGVLLPGADGGAEAQLQSELRRLRGTPVVVNFWGEWCAPCRRELPLLQHAALAHRGDIAFLGVAVLTDRGRTSRFLRSEIALPYPSILDAGGDTLSGIRSAPKTAFYDASGKLVTTKQGEYTSAEELDDDIERYAAR